MVFGIFSMVGVSGFPEFNVLQSLAGLIAGFIIFAFPAVLSKNVGAGDIKLASAVGFSLGIMNLLYAIVLMGLCILAYAVLQSRMTFSTAIHSMIPMGPFIAMAMIVVINL
jgi:prepilin signal peptidase PulO-like enzyme (type II secretory pathway)